MRAKSITVLAIAALLLISGCLPFRNFPTPPPEEDTQATEVAGTLQAYQTQFAALTQEALAGATLPAATEDGQTLPGSPDENEPGATRTPQPSPSYTPTTTNIPTATATATQSICNWVQFIEDATIPDGTKLKGNEPFTKTWRLKNIGTCTWTSGYDLVFTSGDNMGGPAAVSLTQSVKPGETVELSVNLSAPNKVGEYKGYWKLRSDQDITFGLGKSANEAFWVDIEVTALASTPDPNLPLDFAASFCSASWSSPKKDPLPCPSAQEDFANGSIQRDQTPFIELSSEDDEVALIMIPSNGSGGMISGTYPAINVQSGDHFTALTGCIGGSEDCSVTFELNYSANGGPRLNLQTWTETHDGKLTHVDIDLSALDGQSVVFILHVENNNDSSEDDRAFWMVPKIVR